MKISSCSDKIIAHGNSLTLLTLASKVSRSISGVVILAILSGSGTQTPILEYLPEDYEIIDEINVFASGKDGIFVSGTPIGKTNDKGTVDLFVDPNQLSFVTVNLNIQKRDGF